MSITYQQLSDSLAEFSTQISDFITELGLQQLTECDHVALRVNSNETADELTAAFARQGEIISNNVINGRPIMIIKLAQPLQIAGRQVPCIELPYPNKPYPQEGWEHVELVLPHNAQNCEALQMQLISIAPKLTHIFAGTSDINIKSSSPSSATERLANPTIAFKRGNLCVKVHPHPIETIIASEK